MTHEQKIESLSNEIRKALPYLNNIEVGQIFYSSYYGNIVATKVSKIKINLINIEIFDIYGFDIKEGLPRSIVYPKECTLVGHEIKLNDVLAWLDNLNICYYVSETGHIYDGFITLSLSKWNLEKPYLKDQSVELVNFLYSLIEQNNDN